MVQPDTLVGPAQCSIVRTENLVLRADGKAEQTMGVCSVRLSGSSQSPGGVGRWAWTTTSQWAWRLGGFSLHQVTLEVWVRYVCVSGWMRALPWLHFFGNEWTEERKGMSGVWHCLRYVEIPPVSSASSNMWHLDGVSQALYSLLILFQCSAGLATLRWQAQCIVYCSALRSQVKCEDFYYGLHHAQTPGSA